MNIAQRLAANPGGTLPHAFSGWDELKAAYRFLDGPGVSFEKILTPHWEWTRAACRNRANICSSKTPPCQIIPPPRRPDLGPIGDG